MEKYKVISYKKELGKFDHYIFNLHCNIHNYDYIVEGTFKSCEETLKASNCGCKYCASGTKEGKEYRNKQIIKILEDKDIEKMPGWLIKFLISVEKYPKEFYKIVNTKPNSDERKQIIDDIRKNSQNNISEEQYNNTDDYIPNNYDNEGYNSEDVIDILSNIGHKLNTEEEISMILNKTPFIIEFFNKDLQNNHDKSEGYGTSNLYYLEIKKKFDEGKLTKFENIIYQRYINDCIELDNLRKIV